MFNCPSASPLHFWVLRDPEAVVIHIYWWWN